MQKTSVKKPKIVQPGKMIALRIDSRIRYLAEVGAAAKKMNLTQYLEWALEESFKQVSLHVAPEIDVTYTRDSADGELSKQQDYEQELLAKEQLLLSNQAHLLWHESEFVRLQMRDKIAPHTLDKEYHGFMEFIHSQPELRIAQPKGGYKLDREKIGVSFGSICFKFWSLKGKGLL